MSPFRREYSAPYPKVFRINDICDENWIATFPSGTSFGKRKSVRSLYGDIFCEAGFVECVGCLGSKGLVERDGFRREGALYGRGRRLVL